MKYLSVCSGIDAASVAWQPLGWVPVAFSEIEPFPCSVLAHHYPNTTNWGDMTRYQEWPDVSIDLLCDCARWIGERIQDVDGICRENERRAA